MVPMPNEEPNAIAATSPPPSHPETPCVHQPIPHEEPHAVAAILPPASLDAHIERTPSEEPNAVAILSLKALSFTRPSSPPYHLHASRPTSRAVSQSPSITGHAMAEAQSGRLPNDAQPAAADTVHLPFAGAHLPALSASNSRASSAARDYCSDNKLPTTSKASAAASGARGAVAASLPASTKANCRAGAVAPAGPIQTKSRAGTVAANDLPQSKANCRPGAAAVMGPAKSKANRTAGSAASIDPIQTKIKKTARAATASGTKVESRAGSAATGTGRKPLPAEAGSALTTIQEGELNQSRAGVWCMLLQLATGKTLSLFHSWCLLCLKVCLCSPHSLALPACAIRLMQGSDRTSSHCYF